MKQGRDSEGRKQGAGRTPTGVFGALCRRRLTPVGIAALLLVLVTPAAGVGLRALSPGVLTNRSAPALDVVDHLAAPARPVSVYPKLDTRLLQLLTKRPLSLALTGIRQVPPEPSPSGKVRVLVDARRAAEARAAVSRLGGKAELTRDGIVVALMPAASLPALSQDPAVRFVRAPSPAIPAQVNGEEVNASGASAWQAKGLTGKGVKVAIIDAGFTGLAARQAPGDLPASIVTADFCGGHFNDAEVHGTAVAEIVHEMAPDAQLYLACINTDADMALAEQWAKSQRAQIVNFSIGFFGNRGDGSSLSGQVVTDARSNGILWVNAAGNEAQTHWMGTFADANRDGFNEFDPATGNEVNGFWWPRNSTICGFVTWDEWPAARSDFDLGIYVQSLNEVYAWSAESQTGTQPPVEGGCAENPWGVDVVVGWVIGGYRVVSNPRLDLFSYSPQLQYSVPAGSVTDPATSPSAFAVGALCWQTNALESYSSQGPTIDGRIKPDIAGHTAVSNATYGNFTSCPSGFAGTSASSPEVAGAAALVKQAYPAWNADQIQAFLEKRAIDLGTPGKDNQYGAGQLNLGAAADTTAPQARALTSIGRKGTRVALLSRVFDESGAVSLIEQVRRNGRVIATLRAGPVKTTRARTVASFWKAPVKTSGRIQHCVQATDEFGNKSRASCATVTLR
jgi:subtilisin family serine protease